MQFLMDDALPARCWLTTFVTALAFLLAGCSVVEDLVERVPEQSVIDLGIGTGPWDGGTSHMFVHGAVVKNAAIVVLRFADGSELTARPRDPGPRFPFAVYVFADPQLALNGAVVLAVDRDGAELGRSSAP